MDWRRHRPELVIGTLSAVLTTFIWWVYGGGGDSWSNAKFRMIMLPTQVAFLGLLYLILSRLYIWKEIRRADRLKLMFPEAFVMNVARDPALMRPLCSLLDLDEISIKRTFKTPVISVVLDQTTISFWQGRDIIEQVGELAWGDVESISVGEYGTGQLTSATIELGVRRPGLLATLPLRPMGDWYNKIWRQTIEGWVVAIRKIRARSV